MIKKIKNKVVISDLDGTIALIEHLRHHVEKEKKDWDAFNQEIDKDEPNIPIIECLKSLKAAGYLIYIYTGRVDSTKDKTEKWLKDNNVEYDEMRMRPSASRIDDTKLKKNWLDWDFPTEEEKKNILCVFEDRDKMVKMWRDQGLVCMQVAEGNF